MDLATLTPDIWQQMKTDKKRPEMVALATSYRALSDADKTKLALPAALTRGLMKFGSVRPASKTGGKGKTGKPPATIGLNWNDKEIDAFLVKVAAGDPKYLPAMSRIFSTWQDKLARYLELVEIENARVAAVAESVARINADAAEKVKALTLSLAPKA